MVMGIVNGGNINHDSAGLVFCFSFQLSIIAGYQKEVTIVTVNGMGHGGKHQLKGYSVILASSFFDTVSRFKLK